MLPASSQIMFRRRAITVVLLTTLCAVGAALLELVRPTFYTQLEYRLRDLVARSGRTAPANPDLVFLAIDPTSVKLDETDLELFSSAQGDPKAQRALGIMIKGWPWEREIYAMILERLIGAGAKVVAFDCLFPEPGPGDDAFRAALDRFKSQVVIGSNFISPDNVDIAAKIRSTHKLPADTLIAKTGPPDDRVGFTNFLAGENRIVRGAQFRAAYREGENPTAIYFSLSARAVSKAGHPELVPNEIAELPIRFTGPPGAGFRPRPLFEIFVPDYWEHNFRSGESLRNKIIIVGAEGKWQKDELPTPFGPMAGAEVHLNALNALLHGEFLVELPPAANVLVVTLAALLGATLCFTIRSPWLRFLSLLAANGVVALCVLWSYNFPGICVPCLTPLLALNSNVLLCLVSDFTFERIERARLRSTLKTRDDLTHMIVHDLRSPLTIVTGYIDALKRMASNKLTPTEAKFIARAERGADDMRDMITTLLDVGRLEAGEMPLRLEAQDIAQIAREAAARFSPVLGGRTLLCDLPPEPMVVSCDADVIRRVLDNLISNALKFTKADGTIRVSVQRNAVGATISVGDNGQGISPDQHEHIFEKFGQTQSGARRRHSTGLGLAFCRLAVEAHAGKIGVESEPGKGSAFQFSLPTRQDERIAAHKTSDAALR